MIYQHWLSDHSGNAPSAGDTENIVSDIELYLQLKPEGNDFAHKVDTIVDGCPKIAWDKGKRRYLEQAHHFERTRRLCYAMTEAGKTDILRPFLETGYTDNAYTRLK
ncbi:hypothetical protein BK809_0001703 [Diplodia seriata]|uniref:Uncharacterized protein n=1 Tax=Diplodia seriata TaxID=420778 RepID=A0A1S8BAN8_9PEZI|nr:hypothetical protein BK809_0001703 [Diplodia seriata]